MAWVTGAALLTLSFYKERTGNPRISSRITSVAGLPVWSQYEASFSASIAAKFKVILLVVHFLFILEHTLKTNFSR